MLRESLKIFLDLWKLIDDKAIIDGVLHSWELPQSDTHTLNFMHIYREILDILIRAHGRPDFKNLESKMWFDTLKTLFSIKDKFGAAERGKQNISKDFISKKISDLMQEMSENIEFDDIIKVLLEIDPAADYCYTKNWFQQLFISKNDQELLYTSAKRLLSNENSAMIDTIVERYNVGFIGSRDKQVCALCETTLGGFVNDCAFILTM